MIRMEFGIIEQFDVNWDYGQDFHRPEKYNCIILDDDLYMNDWYDSALAMPTYFHSINRPAHSFARWGVTLIPPSSLPIFLIIIQSDKRYQTHTELKQLSAMIEKAIAENKFMIHLGV